jgi:hypothetical protein
VLAIRLRKPQWRHTRLLKDVIFKISARQQAQQPLPKNPSLEEKMLHALNVLVKTCKVLYRNWEEQSDKAFQLSLENSSLKIDKMMLEFDLKHAEERIRELQR